MAASKKKTKRGSTAKGSQKQREQKKSPPPNANTAQEPPTWNELQTTEEELQAAKNETRTITDKLNTANKELDKAKREAESSASELKSVKAKLEAIETDLEKSRDELRRVREKEKLLAERLARLSNEEEPSPADLPSSIRMFTVYIHAQDGQYHGRILYALDQRKKKAFKGIDGKAIAEFIKKHPPHDEDFDAADATQEVVLPDEDNRKLMEDEGQEPHAGDNRNRTKFSQDDTRPKVLHNITLSQSGKVLQDDHPARARSPFEVATQLRLPTKPSRSSLNAANSIYQIHLLATDVANRKVLFRKRCSGSFIPGNTDYTDRIQLPNLLPGDYSLRIVAKSRFNNINETRVVKLSMVG